MSDWLERFIDRPSGGRIHQTVIGLFVAAGLLAVGIWLLSHAGAVTALSIPARGGRIRLVDPTGLIAALTGGTCFALGLHLHAGWYWGLRNARRAAPELARVAMLMVAFVLFIATVARLAFLTLR